MLRHHHTFLDNLRAIVHSPQFRYRGQIQKWLSVYVRKTGHDVDVPKFCRQCRISQYAYDCALSGSPIVTMAVCRKVKSHMQSAAVHAIPKHLMPKTPTSQSSSK